MDTKSIGNPLLTTRSYLEKDLVSSPLLPLQQKKAVAEPATEARQPNSAGTSEQVAQALQSINKTMQSLSTSLEFRLDESTKRTIVKVVDKQSGEVIRQMPTKEALEIAKALDKAQGLLVRQKA